jgi:urease accessory protein
MVAEVWRTPPEKAKSNPPGSGRLHLATTSSNKASFASLLGSYPLKLLAPHALPSQLPQLAICYTLAYGGGLVAGDVISLLVTIDQGGWLVLLTQGSTKVFKSRPGIRPLSLGRPAPGLSDNTIQRLRVTFQPRSLLLHLPDPLAPFAKSRYEQHQRFDLPQCGTASLLVLDAVSSGRGARPTYGHHAGILPRDEEEETWAMDLYASTNDVYLGSTLLMRDRLVLEAPAREKLAPYHNYTTLLVCGPLMEPLVNHLAALTDKRDQAVFQQAKPMDLVWSYSPIPSTTKAGILRVAGISIEGVRDWIRKQLVDGGLQQLVGDALWPRVF